MEKQRQYKSKPKPNSQNYKLKNYKKYGTTQTGHGVGFLNKESIKKKYFHSKERKNFKFPRNEGEEATPNEATATTANEEHKDEDPYARYQEDREAFDSLPSKKRKLSKLKRAQMEFQNRIKEKEQKKRDKEAKIKEIEENKKRSKEIRLARNINLSKKTKRGQPLMKSRMEVLLGDIESLVSKGK